MYEYIKGKIADIEANYIVIDNNGIGYIVYVLRFIFINMLRKMNLAYMDLSLKKKKICF